MSRNGPGALVFHALFVAFMLAPLAMVCWVAFTPENFLQLPTRDLSLRWFRAVLDSDFVPAFRNSVVLATVAATVATALSVPAAMALARYRFPGRDALAAFFLAPLMVPHLVLGVSLLRLYSEIGITGTFAGLLFGHVVLVMPFTLRLALASLTGLDRRVEWAAESLGAERAAVLRRVTLPMILPGLAGGWILAFIQSFDELTLTIFVASPSTTTLPVRMYQYVSDNIDPLIMAASACLILLTAVLMVVLDRLYGLDRLLIGKGG